MKILLYSNKLIMLSDDTTAESIMQALYGKKYFECYSDAELTEHEFKFFDMIDWEWVHIDHIDIEEIEIINL